MLQENARAIYLHDYQVPDFLVDEVHLQFELQQEQTYVNARLNLRRNPQAEPAAHELHLSGEDLELLRIELNDQPLTADDYQQTDTQLIIRQVPQTFTLFTRVCIHPESNTLLEGLYCSDQLFCTQCEAEGFRRITFYPDRPDVMAEFTTTIIADKARYPVLLSNGNLIRTEDLDDGRHLCSWHDPFKKPCYLFALVAGDLAHKQDCFTTCSGREIQLSIYTEAENIDRCDHAMQSLKKAMRWDEKRFGREYDLDLYMIVAVNSFNMGAMENKGLNIFNSKYVLARPETATDKDYQGIEAVIAHEYFHNWSGNRITCRDWFQLSLKEGFTVYRDQEFSSDMGLRAVKRIEDVSLLRTHQFAEDSSPMAHPIRPDSYIEINNFYTVTVYEKGAEVVRMMARILGQEAFRKGTDLYFERYDGQAVTTEDFVRSMEEASGVDLTQFRLWYSQAGTPVLHISTYYDDEKKQFTLEVKQQLPDTPGQSNKQPMHIPLAIGLLNAVGQDIPSNQEGRKTSSCTSRILDVRQSEQSFTFSAVEEKPVISLLRGFSAPVKLEYPRSDAERMFLIMHDHDDFSRWDATQSLILSLVEQLLARPRHEWPKQLEEGFFACWRTILQETQTDAALRADMLSLPAETWLGDQQQPIDVDGISAARQFLMRSLAQHLQADFLHSYHQYQDSQAYAPDPPAIARRALKNTCLAYLVESEDKEALELAYQQYLQASNMTDKMAALSALSHTRSQQRQDAMQHFEQQWAHDPLVMDKWFMLQASTKRDDALQQVKQLLSHPAFSIENPNKVRSLIGVFCNANRVAFHAIDGSGYEFAYEQILRLNPINPQIGARLARVFSPWRRFDTKRQALMKASLQNMLDHADLNKAIFEVVEKSLND
ncbi:MAG: aminopeptidase N [gamma proteobacterium symbiont of Bathyaustriella thionipta]|nr:aminopeptidase N [gamma proteobacterium symbiont of Bathyaustriella thionipta]